MLFRYDLWKIIFIIDTVLSKNDYFIYFDI